MEQEPVHHQILDFSFFSIVLTDLQNFVYIFYGMLAHKEKNLIERKIKYFNEKSMVKSEGYDKSFISIHINII